MAAPLDRSVSRAWPASVAIRPTMTRCSRSGSNIRTTTITGGRRTPRSTRRVRARSSPRNSLKAAQFAADLANALKARVTVLGVNDETQLMPQLWGAGEWAMLGDNMPSVGEVRDAIEKRTHDDVMAPTLAAMGDVAGGCESLLEWGHPAETICRYAVDNAVDLIVIGSRGRSSFSGLILGSVSQQVTTHATCAVTVVP